MKWLFLLCLWRWLQVFLPDPTLPNRCLSAVRFALRWYSGSFQVVNVNFVVAEYDTFTNRLVAGGVKATVPFSIKCASATFPGTNLWEAAFNQCVPFEPTRYVWKGGSSLVRQS